MIDISVSGIEKEFEVGTKILDGVTFQVDTGERVGLLGKNGAGKTTLFRILTGEVDADEGQVVVAPGKRMGLISQIPRFPEGFTVEDVLRSAFSGLTKVKRRMEELELQMAGGASEEQLREYDMLVNRFQSGGGYEMDVEIDKICNGLGILPEQRRQEFSSLSGGEKTRVNLARLLLEKTASLSPKASR